MWFWKGTGVDVLDVPKRLFDGCSGGSGRVVGTECLITENLDATIVEIEPNLVGDLPQILSVEQFDGMRVAVLLETLGKLLCWVREPPSCNDDASLWAVFFTCRGAWLSSPVARSLGFDEYRDRVGADPCQAIGDRQFESQPRRRLDFRHGERRTGTVSPRKQHWGPFGLVPIVGVSVACTHLQA